MDLTKGSSTPQEEQTSKIAIEEDVKMGIFEKYLTFWILLFMVLGLLIGKVLPEFSETLTGLEYAGFSIPIAICLFLMMFPTLINIELTEIKTAIKYPKPLLITMIANWLVPHLRVCVNPQYFGRQPPVCDWSNLTGCVAVHGNGFVLE